MPTTQEHQGVYPKSWSMVTAFLWDKYNGHAWVRDVEVIDRHIDGTGRLHSRRLLTLYSKTPFVLRPILGASVRPFYLLEDSIVDLEKRTMEVNVCNVNLRNICFCRSESSYTPDSDNPSYTRYGIMVQTRAFPKAGQEPANSHTTSTGGQDMSDKSTPRFQAIHRTLENFVGGLILGNVKMGEKKIQDWARQFAMMHCGGRQNLWLCRHMHESTTEASPASSLCATEPLRSRAEA